MKFTNVHDLPKSIVEALTEDFDPRNIPKNIFWLTKLLGPPRPAILQKMHWDQIEEDISDSAARFIGSAVHERIQKKSEAGARLMEEKAYIDIANDTAITLPFGVPLKNSDTYDPDNIYVTCKLDCYEGDEDIVEDYKCTSVWGYILNNGQPKDDDIKQVNCYRWVLRKLGFECKAGARIVYWFRDWSKTKSVTDARYPNSMIVPVKCPVWDDERVFSYIQERIQVHQLAMTAADDDRGLPVCTETERWARPDQWAVMKPGRKTAMKLFDNSLGAHQMAGTIKGGFVEHRPGKSTRCEDYCNVNQFCDFYLKNH